MGRLNRGTPVAPGARGPRGPVVKLLALVTAIAVTTALQAQSASDLFQKALSKERVDGQFAEAIALYERVVKESAGNRALAARALVQIGRCHERLGRTDAKNAYERVVRDFAEQRASVSEARARLAELVATPAAPAGVVTRQLWKSNAPVASGVRLGRVSPDGRRILASDPQAGLVLYDTSDFAKRSVLVANAATSSGEGASSLWSAFSPSGKQVAYAWFNRTRFDLRVVAVDGHGSDTARVLYANEDIDWIGPYDWSPDGQWIAVQIQRNDRTAQIGLVSASGSLRVLKSVDWQASTNLAFSPDGAFLAYDLPAANGIGERDVFVLAVDGSRQIAAVKGQANDRVLGWAPDGNHLLFISSRAGSSSLWSLAVRAGRPAGAPVLVKPDFGDSALLGLTRSGAVFVQIATGKSTLSVASVDFESGAVLPTAPILSIDGGSAPAWSPDGKHLAYVTNLGKADPLGAASGSEFVTVAIRALDTGQTRELHPALAYFSEQLRWSPDGRSVMGQGADAKQREGVYRVDADTGEAIAIMPIRSDERVVYPQWLPDGKRLAFIRGARTPRFRIQGERSIVERDVTTGTERVLARDTYTNLGGLAVSPDGRELAYGAYDPKTNQSSVMLVALAGGEPRELLRQQNPPLIRNIEGWLPDSRGIILTMWADRVLEPWLIRRDGDAPQKLELGARADYTQVHPDGRRVVFRTPNQSPVQVWVFENLVPFASATSRGVRR